MDVVNILTEVLGYAVAISPVVERLVEVIKGFFPKDIWAKLDYSWKYILTLIVAMVVSVTLYQQTPYWYLVGFTASLGSNFLHDLMGIVREWKKTLEQANGEEA